MAEYTGELFDEMPTGTGRGRINPPIPETKKTVPEITPRSLATPEGQKLIDQVEQQMETTPEPSPVAAAKELLPVAGNTLKNTVKEAGNEFQSLAPDQMRTSDVLAGGAAAYGIYRTLRDKPPPPPPPPAGTFTPPPPPGGAVSVNAPRAEPTFDPLAPANMTMSAGEPILGEKVNNPPMYADDEQRIQRQQYQQKLDAIEKARFDAKQGIVTQAPQPIAEVPPTATSPAVEQLKARVNAIPTPEGSVPPVAPIAAEQVTNASAPVKTAPVVTEPAPAPEGVNAPVKPKKSTTTVTFQPTGALPPQLAEIKGSIPPRVQNAAAAVPADVQAKLAAEGKVGLKGYGSGDVSITNTYGKKAYAAIVDYFNNGQPIGTDENYKIVQGKINKGIPSELAPFFASKLPASEAEAGTFGSKELGEKMAYTADGKIVTSPNAIKNAVAKGGGLLMALSVADAAFAASKGDTSKGGDVLLGAIPGVGPALGLYHGEAGAPTINQKNPDLQRPEVRQTLEKLKQTLSSAEYEKAAQKYLNKVGSFAGMTDRERLMSNIQSRIKRQPSKNTLLP